MEENEKGEEVKVMEETEKEEEMEEEKLNKATREKTGRALAGQGYGV